MSKKHSSFQRPMFRTREALPSMFKTKIGVQILCPFCKPTHAIAPGEPSPCGTVLKLTAVQDIIPTRIVRIQNLKCLKCHEGGGEMVPYMGGFVHLNDCDPKVRLLPQHPNYNPFAGMVFRMPQRARAAIEKITGRAQRVDEIDGEGNHTGKVMGYFFMKFPGAANG